MHVRLLGGGLPGSGKTRVLVYKVEHILNVDPGGKIVVMSFTQDSALEIRKRILDLVPHAAKNVATGTFHSLAFNQLKRGDGGFKGTVLSPGQMKSYIERAKNECKDPEILGMDLNEAVGVIEHLKLTPGYVPGNNPHGRLFTAYSKLTERNNVMDFADMLSRAVAKMQAGEIPPLNCSHLLTDESQDLDEMQYAWCVEHIRRRDNKPGAKFTVVGDDDQSIYKFRRALGYAGMMRFKDEFGAELIMLDTNYRCRPEILSSAAKVINYNENRVTKALDAARKKGGVVEAWQCENAADEANLLINKIKEISAGNPIPPPTKIKARDKDGGIIVGDDNKPVMVEYNYSVGIKADEWAVFARNNHNLKVLAAAMRANGIPHKYSGPNLWSDQPVCFVLALLTSLATGQQAGYDSALHYAGLDEDTIERLHCDYGGDFSQMVYDQNLAKKYGPGTATTLASFNKNVMDWRRAIKNGRHTLAVGGVFNWFLDGLGGYSKNDKDSGRYQREYIALASCREILNAIPGPIMARIALLLGPEEEQEDSDQDNRVTLGTLHSSKGLEFENVWLFSMDDGVIPDLKEWTPAIQEEERRLFYVGMTRAKERLFISCGKRPSSFIEETGIPLHMNLTPGEHVLKAAKAG